MVNICSNPAVFVCQLWRAVQLLDAAAAAAAAGGSQRASAVDKWMIACIHCTLIATDYPIICCKIIDRVRPSLKRLTAWRWGWLHEHLCLISPSSNPDWHPRRQKWLAHIQLFRVEGTYSSCDVGSFVFSQYLYKVHLWWAMGFVETNISIKWCAWQKKKIKDKSNVFCWHFMSSTSHA